MSYKDKHFTVAAFNLDGTFNAGASFSHPFETIVEASRAVEQTINWRAERGKPVVVFKIWSCRLVATVAV